VFVELIFFITTMMLMRCERATYSMLALYTNLQVCISWYFFDARFPWIFIFGPQVNTIL